MARDTKYKMLLRWLPNQYRPFLAQEKKYFDKLKANEINLGDGFNDEVNVADYHGQPLGDILSGLFFFSDSRHGHVFWSQVCNRLGTSSQSKKGTEHDEK